MLDDGQRPRRSNGLRELRSARRSRSAALGHSQSMAKHGYFSHEGWNGTPFWKRIKPTVPAAAGKAWSVGENLIWASPDLSADQAIKIWLNSPPHRKNLLTPAWREIGLGAVHALDAPRASTSGLDVTILTADFGVR